MDFEGKKRLVIISNGALFTHDYGKFATRMVDEQIVRKIKDPSIAEWLLPAFSTTNSNDRVVAAISVMSSLQAFFTYVCASKCGIPRITLLGKPEDFKLLREKVDRLLEFDLKEGHMAAWHQ